MAKEKQEYDYEGDMAMSQLKSIIANAQRIHDMLERDTNLPEWVQSKITLAEDYITTAANYMQGEMKEEADKIHSVHVSTYGKDGEKQLNSPEFKKHLQAQHGEVHYMSDKGVAFKFKKDYHASAFHRGIQSHFKHLSSENDGPVNEDMAMGTGPVNVAANVADPKNKRLFDKPMKRFKNFKAK
jgi:hypothetical protein